MFDIESGKIGHVYYYSGQSSSTDRLSAASAAAQRNNDGERWRGVATERLKEAD